MNPIPDNSRIRSYESYYPMNPNPTFLPIFGTIIFLNEQANFNLPSRNIL